MIIMTAVVDLSNGNTYLASLFVWCMSGTPVILMVKCVLIRVVHVWCATCVMCHMCGVPCVWCAMCG